MKHIAPPLACEPKTKVVSSLHEANDFVVYTTTGALFYDADGSGTGAAVQIALLGTTTHPALTNADFVVI